MSEKTVWFHSTHCEVIKKQLMSASAQFRTHSGRHWSAWQAFIVVMSRAMRDTAQDKRCGAPPAPKDGKHLELQPDRLKSRLKHAATG